jgi:carotenoid 1,2-hydratase
MPRAPVRRAERLLLLINAPANGDFPEIDDTELDLCEERIFRSLRVFGLRIEHQPNTVIRTVPKDFQRLFPATGGALYGPASHGWMASFTRAGSRTAIRGLYLAGGSSHPGPGLPMAATSGRLAAAALLQRLRFDGILPHGGYAWWYVDALSDDGDCGLTVIAFLGSVFSPYYARARRRAQTGPMNHCAFNVALYGRRAERWAMTERGVRQVARNTNGLAIGPSSMRWDGSALEIEIHERCAPIPWPLRGRIRIHPSGLAKRSFALDSRREASVAADRTECAGGSCLLEPRLQMVWDRVLGLESRHRAAGGAFRDWTWSRVASGGSTVVLYDVSERERARTSLALQFAPSGEVISIPTPSPCRLPASGWRINRHTRADPQYPVRVLKTLVDAPFYSRTLLETRVAGVEGRSIHESLDLDRFRSPWVQCLLPFRMPRIPF